MVAAWTRVRADRSITSDGEVNTHPQSTFRWHGPGVALLSKRSRFGRSARIRLRVRFQRRVRTTEASRPGAGRPTGALYHPILDADDTERIEFGNAGLRPCRLGAVP